MSEIEHLHTPFAKYLRDRRIEFLRARSDRQSTIAVGWPDFTVFQPHAAPLLIEFKTAKGKLSADQADVIYRLEARGFDVHVVREVGIAVALVEAWLRADKPEPVADARIVIRKKGEEGDWLWDGKAWLRRACVGDHAHYVRAE